MFMFPFAFSFCSTALFLDPNACCLCTIVFNKLRKPRVLQGLASGDAFLGIVDENLTEEVQEQFVESACWWDDLLKPPHGPHKLSRLARCFGARINEFVVLEETCS